MYEDGRISIESWRIICLCALIEEKRKRRERAEAKAREDRRAPARNRPPRKTGVRPERKRE